MRGTLEKLETRQWVVVESGGHDLFGILHRPSQVDNAPVVVVLHGFASSKQGSNRCYVHLAEAFAKEGIATLRFDFRGSGDSEGSLSAITLRDLVADAGAILESVEALEGIDSSRIFLFGASLGGSLAVFAAEQFQMIQAMALWAPVASGELWYRDFLIAYPQYVGADPSKVLSSYRGISLHPDFRDQFARMSAHTVAAKLKTPILFMHGEKDDIVSIAHQEAFRAMCEKEGGKNRFLRYPDGEHALGFSPNFSAVIQESLNWFKHGCL